METPHSNVSAVGQLEAQLRRGRTTEHDSRNKGILVASLGAAALGVAIIVLANPADHKADRFLGSAFGFAGLLSEVAAVRVLSQTASQSRTNAALEGALAQHRLANPASIALPTPPWEQGRDQ